MLAAFRRAYAKRSQAHGANKAQPAPEERAPAPVPADAAPVETKAQPPASQVSAQHPQRRR
jgi:hypothetical protein